MIALGHMPAMITSLQGSDVVIAELEARYSCWSRECSHPCEQMDDSREELSWDLAAPFVLVTDPLRAALGVPAQSSLQAMKDLKKVYLPPNMDSYATLGVCNL